MTEIVSIEITSNVISACQYIQHYTLTMLHIIEVIMKLHVKM